MGDDVLDERVQGGGQVFARRPNHRGRFRQVEGEITALILEERFPEGRAVAGHLDGVALRDAAFALRSTGCADDGGQGAFEAGDLGVEFLGALAIRERLDLEAECGQRRAEAVREVGDRFAFDGDDLVDAIGETVEGGADLGDLGGPVTVARASRSPPARRSAVLAVSSSGRAKRRETNSAPAMLSSRTSRPAPSRTSRRGIRPSCNSAPVR